jgi:hypothetical protein
MSFRSLRPDSNEYNAFYATYVNAIEPGDILQILTEQKLEVLLWMDSATPEMADFRYAEGKWSAKEVIGHMVDTEWVFAYRLLRFSRGDKTPLAGMDQDLIMAGANFQDRDLSDMAQEFKGLRRATIQLVGSLSEDMMHRSGTASGFGFTVRAMCWIIAGHCQHHLNILHERYVVL